MPRGSQFCINTTRDHSLRHFDRYLIFLTKFASILQCQYSCVLLKMIFHVLGKMLCKIILGYYKLHRPAAILGGFSVNSTFITIIGLLLNKYQKNKVRKCKLWWNLLILTLKLKVKFRIQLNVRSLNILICIFCAQHHISISNVLSQVSATSAK